MHQPPPLGNLNNDTDLGQKVFRNLFDQAATGNWSLVLIQTVLTLTTVPNPFLVIATVFRMECPSFSFRTMSLCFEPIPQIET